MPKAFVVTQGDVTVEELAAAEVAPFQKVRQVEFVESGPVRVLITGGAEELGRAFCEVLGAQGHQLVITGRDEKTLGTAETELRAKGVVLSYDPGMADVGLMRRSRTMCEGTPDEQRVSEWARSQHYQGRFTPVEQSAGLLARIVSGEFDHRSGGLVTSADC